MHILTSPLCSPPPSAFPSAFVPLTIWAVGSRLAVTGLVAGASSELTLERAAVLPFTRHKERKRTEGRKDNNGEGKDTTGNKDAIRGWLYVGHVEDVREGSKGSKNTKG